MDCFYCRFYDELDLLSFRCANIDSWQDHFHDHPKTVAVSFNYFTPRLSSKHAARPFCPPFLHMKGANRQFDLLLLTSDPSNTRITTSIPAPLPLNAFPPIRRVLFPSQMTDGGSGGCQTPLLVSSPAY